MTAREVVAPRRGWYHGWNIVAACVISTALANGLSILSFSLFVEDWSKDLNAPISTLQLGMVPLGVLSGILAAFAGVLADKYPARWLFGAGLTGVTLFELGVSFVTEIWQFMVLFGLLLPVALTFAATLPANALVSRWFVRRIGLALGLTAFGQPAAGVILPPLIAAILPDLGWRTIWRLAALLSLALMPIILWVMRNRPDERDGMHYLTADGGAPAHAGHGHGAKSAGSLTWRDVFKRRNFWILVITYLPMVAMYGGLMQNMAPIAAAQNVSAQTAGVLLSAFSLSQVASTIIMGLFSDRFGNRVPFAALAFGTALGGVVVAFSHDAPTMGLGVVLIGLSGGLWTLLGAAIATEFGAAAMGRAFGLASLFLPAIVFTPFIIAKVQESTGSYTPALLGFAAVTAFGGVVCLFLRERPRGEAAAQPAE